MSPITNRVEIRESRDKEYKKLLNGEVEEYGEILRTENEQQMENASPYQKLPYYE